MESSFTTLIGLRGWHVYQKSTWKNPKKDGALSFKKETDPVALRFDPFSIAFTRKSIKYLTPPMVGRILRSNTATQITPFLCECFFTSLWRTIKNSGRAGSGREDRLEKIITK